MARTIAQIETSLVTRIQRKDRTIDVTTGPIYELLLTPIPPELSITEGYASRLASLHSPLFAQVATPDEVDALRVSMRLARGEGEKSRGTQMFWSTGIPDAGIIIPIGTLVATSDNRYTYRTTVERALTAENASSYYNSLTFRYELSISIEAIASGIEYDLPATRINKLVSNIQGLDGTENITSTFGGSEDESTQETVSRIKQRFEGFNTGTDNGLEITYIKNYAPTLVQDVSLIKPKDGLFKRHTRRVAMDIYLSGTNTYTYSQSYTLTAEDASNLINDTSILKIILDKQPVLSIVDVSIEGVSGTPSIVSLERGTDLFEYLFAKDNGVLYNSYRAEDSVWIRGGINTTINGIPIIAEGSKINIEYVAEKLIIDIQDNLFNQETTLFNTDALVRKALERQIIVEIYAKLITRSSSITQSSEQVESTLDALTAKVRAYIENNEFGRTIAPEAMKQKILANSTSAIDLYIQTFRKKERALRQVETIDFNANEIPSIYEEEGTTFTVKLLQ